MKHDQLSRYMAAIYIYMSFYVLLLYQNDQKHA